MPDGVDVVIQTENGGIGVGPAPEPGCEDRDRANAGNQPITLIPGGSYFDSAMSFAMIRGGHVDATFLGTLQVDEKGNIANWIVPGKMLAGMGGAMDLVTGAKVVYIVSEHCSKDGASKLMKQCTFPLTGAEEADVIITERALFRRSAGEGWVLEEVASRLHARRHRRLHRHGVHGRRRREAGRLRRVTRPGAPQARPAQRCGREGRRPAGPPPLAFSRPRSAVP